MKDCIHSTGILAADMAVENVILDLHWKRCEIEGDDIRRRVLQDTLEKCGRGNAETIYAYLCSHEKERNILLSYAWMFRQDRHDIWGADKRKTTAGSKIWNSSGKRLKRIRNWMQRAMRRQEDWNRVHSPVSSHCQKESEKTTLSSCRSSWSIRKNCKPIQIPLIISTTPMD
jgi:hypothetical protein